MKVARPKRDASLGRVMRSLRAIFCGSRYFRDEVAIEREMRLIEPTLLIHGDCQGADRISAAVAERLWIEHVAFPADWDFEGLSAGPSRNALMLERGKPDLVVAFPLPGSRGTWDMVRQAKDARVPTKVIHYDPKRGV